ncbi:hypothetical protein MPTK1_7g11460 [Marchantia polymorpha subsp. ruderalis]|uniref:Armadillo-like helical domain-containing protein n=2 Tax=Marchantia polymorpha TaxID=3197 RepID=A0A176VQZ0_MARPO|nr:hypothetical protein AXG93_1713s1090 [Marchantia polymorpha subsp. ruderalis]PTQ49273.1 hypothetical protein MARPO_0003s0160 [Marchantia polymorpha]BBN17037.1 hypothetical protein Mp_7g11460 [Marchantia polymorpha subsp. ruderalis]|eukprot:PTQ49273.1 hypothetical protein MARPO_0003s0160 [Marchantia polymorpha]
MQTPSPYSSRNGLAYRSAENYKAPLKEKFVSLYEDIFAGRSPIHTARDQGIQGRAIITRFWDELLLLKVNETFLAQVIAKASEDQLRGNLKPIINELFATYSAYLSDGNFIRVAHALETLTILLREIFKKRFTEQGYSIITLVAGSVEQSDSFFRRLVTSISSLLTRDDVPVLVKSLGLRVYLTILIATDNVNTNTIASYLFVNNIFDSLLAVFNIKLSADRKKLELDVTLVLILLLLWRESANPYAERLASTAAPVIPLLHTVSSLLLTPARTSTENETSNSSYTVWSGADGVFSLIGNLLGLWPSTDSSGQGGTGVAGTGSAKGTEVLDVKWCNNTAAIVLIYFLCYLNPAMKSTQIWPSSDFSPVQGAGTTSGQTAALLWIDVFKSFLTLSKDVLSRMSTTGVVGVMRGKLCLTILRCMVENHVSADFLSRADADSFSLNQMPAIGVVGIPCVLQFRSLSCVIVDLATSVLQMKPDVPHMDSDVFHRAALLIPIVLNHLRSRGWQLLSTSINWLGLWQALAGTCTWCATETMFQKPGVPELAELTLGILESCIGNSQELCGAPDETDRLHAMVLANSTGLEQLAQTASTSRYGDTGKSALRDGLRLVNVAAIKFHYEVQVAALGVRGQPTFEQALLGVKKKGLANLKLKHLHAGPGHSYTEGTVEHRILINLVRYLVAEHRQHLSSSGKLKLELETT